MVNSCCENCELVFRESERAFLPYSDFQEITFISEGFSESIIFRFGKTITEKDQKQCKGFPERHCYLTLKQYGVASGTEATAGSDFELQISTFQDQGFLLSLFMVTSDTKYQYNGIVYSGNKVDEELIPDYDSLIVRNKLFLNVYKIVGPEDPVVPETLNQVTEFYFTKQEGLIRFKTKDGKVWDLVNPLDV